MKAGIDYFLEKDQRKATYLQKKMTSLLANPDNIRILEREYKKSIPKSELSQSQTQKTESFT